MNILVSKRSWMLAPAVFVLGFGFFAVCWAVNDPCVLMGNFDADGHSMVELMTLPLFAAMKGSQTLSTRKPPRNNPTGMVKNCSEFRQA